MLRRGQAALEYLVTYGWAFLVILILLGALAYFGVVNPNKWIPSKCDTGAQLVCVDYEIVGAPSLTTGTASISLYVRNDFGKDINITKARVRTDVGDLTGSSSSVIILAGEKGEINITDLSNLIMSGDRKSIRLSITFKKNEAGASEHTLTGVVYDTAK